MVTVLRKFKTGKKKYIVLFVVFILWQSFWRLLMIVGVHAEPVALGTKW